MDNQSKPFDKEVNRVLEHMRFMDPSSEEYRKAAESLKILCEARGKKRSFPIDPEVAVTLAVGFVEVLLILNHERLYVITSKAMNRIRK